MRDYYDGISFATTITGKKMHLFLARYIADYDVTPEQWSVLNVIQLQGPLTQKKIAELVEKDTPTVNRIIEVLLRKELVRRELSETDRRKTFLSVTEKGDTEVAALRPVVEKACAHMFAGLNEEQLEQYMTLLSHITKNIE
ncbi:MarR family winged helix-turn-helix transcriptional regulator [Listeria ilorinensis]|uniref:MarR family winged helix-turn-helix transcriptional regulator n=1 Tax=Listeria ilorinensis TaxID=2867439 RepID=UPI001EF56215|nr:MarR family transcriptional regulator [Listeria ilorinensis]